MGTLILLLIINIIWIGYCLYIDKTWYKSITEQNLNWSNTCQEPNKDWANFYKKIVEDMED